MLPAKRGAGPASYPFIEVDATYDPLLSVLGTITPDLDGCLAVLDAPGLRFDLQPRHLEPWITGHWIEREP